MKKILFLTLTCAVFAACSEPITRRDYRLETPAVPTHWSEVLGEPMWRFKWVDRSGNMVEADTAASFYPAAEILQECANPVLAFPYWPERGILPGIIKPAGAIFPIDAEGSAVKLSFQGGIDANFYLELAIFAKEKRLPRNFDWLRFRELFTQGQLGEEICKDPWTADWKTIAESTAASGFNAKRIKPRTTASLVLNLPAEGPWFGTSPFAEPADWGAGTAISFETCGNVDSYFCKDGVLRITEKIHSWILWN